MAGGARTFLQERVRKMRTKAIRDFAVLLCAIACVHVDAVQFITHRGDMAVERENSLAAVKRAHAYGAKGCEIDVRMRHDGVPALGHDALEVDADTLESVLAYMAKNDMFPLLDVKEPKAEKLALEMVRRHGLAGKTMSIVYTAEDAKRQKSLEPDMSPFILLGRQKGESDDAYFARYEEAFRISGADGAFLSTGSAAFAARFRAKGYRTMYGSFTQPGQSDRFVEHADFLIVDDPAFIAFAGRCAGSERGNPRRAVSPFNDGWEFQRVGESAWTGVSVPHDAACRLALSRGESPDHGFAPSPVTRYRKAFPKPDGAGRFSLKFDGVYMDSQVFVNGVLAGGRRSGYLPFEVPLRDMADTNVVEVVCRAPTPNTRWYAGVGILRDVWLVRREGWTLEPESVSIAAELRKDGSAVVRVEAEGAKILEPEGGEFVVERPALWTPETPSLHQLSVTAENAEGERDTIDVRYGIRTLEFTKDRGLLLNGVPYRIKGVCQHDTFGPIGAALNIPDLKRQLSALKNMGANAIRTAHNPFSPQFYDLCDEMGFLVMDEAFDQWKVPKRKYDYSRFFGECWKKDLSDFIRRDRNHPCVALWSIGNEICDISKGNPDVESLVRQMVALVHSLDVTRPVTSAINSPGAAVASGVVGALDAVGLNYNVDWYEKLRGVKPLFGSETAPSLADRDTYLFKNEDGKMKLVQACRHRENSYSPETISWAASAEKSLRVQMDSPWSAGEFVWCTFDYLGEPFHTGRKEDEYWPARSSYWGLCDLAGLPKDRYYLYRSQWNPAPTVHLLPDWTHPGFEGKVFPVWCYTNAEEAELFLNGRSMGVRKFSDTSDLHLSWDVAYEPGVLEVKARFTDGTVSVDRRETAGTVASLRKTMLFEADGVYYYRFDAVDSRGVRVLSCQDAVMFDVRNGEFVCAVNGSATDHTPFTSRTRCLFQGSIVVIARSASDAQPEVDCRYVK